MRFARFLSFLLIAVALFVGCSKDKNAAVRPDPDGDKSVKLIEPGNGPKTPMRFHVTKGQSQEALMTMTMGMQMMGQNVKIPPILMTMVMDVTDVMADGRIRYDFRILKIDLAPSTDGSFPASKLGAIKESFKGLESAKGHALITDRGIVKEADIELGPGAPPQIKQMVDSLKQSLGQMVAPLPEEPVGVGSKWEVTTNVTANGVTLKQVAQYEMLSRSGDTGKMNVSITQSADPQSINSPQMPAGAKVELVSMSSHGDGTIDFDLSKLCPSTSAVKLASKMSMSIDMGGKAQKQDVAMDIDMNLAAK